MKHICMLIANTCQYDSRTLREVHTLVAVGCRVTVLAVWDPGCAEREEHAGYAIRRLKISSRRLPKWGFLLPLKIGEWLLRVWLAALRLRPDALHCHNVEPLMPAVLAGMLLGRPVIYDSREMTLDKTYYHQLPRLLKGLLWLYEYTFTRRCRAIFDVSPERAEIFARRYRLPAPDILPNYPPVAPVDGNKRLHQELGLPEGMPIVLYHGLLRRDRGVLELIRAVATLPEVALVLLGPGEDTEACRALVNELGCGARVKVPGPVAPHLLPEYTAGADLGALLIKNTCPNNYYAAPTKVYDYLMAGLPVLVSDFPAFRSLVDRGLGRAANPEDVDQIARAIRELLADPAAHEARRRRCRAAAEKELNWEAVAPVLLGAYRRLGVLLPAGASR